MVSQAVYVQKRVKESTDMKGTCSSLHGSTEYYLVLVVSLCLLSSIIYRFSLFGVFGNTLYVQVRALSWFEWDCDTTETVFSWIQR